MSKTTTTTKHKAEDNLKEEKAKSSKVAKPKNSKVEAKSVEETRSNKSNSDKEKTLSHKESTSDIYSAIYKNCQIGMESIRAIKPQVEDAALKNLFNRQYKGYETLSKEVELQATKEGSEVSDPTIVTKAMLWGGVMFNTFKDKSTSKIAEIMIQGINMGIINLTKLQNNLDEEKNDKLLQKLITQYQSNLDVLKAYL